MSTERLGRPTRCPGGGHFDKCGSTKLKKLDDGDYECTVCGYVMPPRRVTTTELRIAKCRDCGESFLWKWQERTFAVEPPRKCGACRHTDSAWHHEQSAKKHRQQAATARESQRRAVARFKPPEALEPVRPRSAAGVLADVGTGKSGQ